MRFRIICAAALLAASVAATVHAGPAKKTCAAHADCAAQNAYCDAGKCKRLSPEESYLSVELETATAFPAYLYVDGALIGTLPWEGIVATGGHTIRVESQGMAPVEFQGTSAPSAVDRVPIRMAPPSASTADAGQSGASASEPADSGGRGVPGTLHFGAQGGAGYGTAVGADNWRRPVVTLLGGVTFGLRVVTEPIWLDVGLAVTSTTLKMTDYVMQKDGELMEWGDFFKLNAGLDFRLLFPIRKNFFYLGAELEPGVGISNHNYVYGILRFAMSLFVHELVEIRINPLGVEYMQELALKRASYILSANATLGVSLRFPKKPLF